jgi:arginase
MPVAAIMGSAPASLQGKLTHPLPPSQFFYVSADVGDDGDWQFQKAKGLRWLDPQTVIRGPVHIHFDLDVLDPAEFPYLAYQDGRLSMQAGLDIVRRIAADGQPVGLTISEFAPADDAEAIAGGRFVKQLCDAAIAS